MSSKTEIKILFILLSIILFCILPYYVFCNYQQIKHREFVNSKLAFNLHLHEVMILIRDQSVLNWNGEFKTEIEALKSTYSSMNANEGKEVKINSSLITKLERAISRNSQNQAAYILAELESSLYNSKEIVSNRTTALQRQSNITYMILVLMLILLMLSTLIVIRIYISHKRFLIKANRAQDIETTRMRDYISYIEALSDGNFDQVLDVVNEQDTLAKSLLKMKIQLRSNKDENSRRNWLNIGLAKFNDLLRSGNDLRELSNLIVSNLSSYLNINQAFLFIIDGNDDEAHLLLMGAYAYDRKKFIEKKIYKGEGLVGQSWIEGNSIYLTEVPTNYVNITSGLGSAPPSCIFIVPLKFKDKIYGAIEMASFHKLDKYEREFVETLSEGIAGTIATVKINETTINLLEETKAQASKLKNHEENIEQKMQQLQIAKEEMARKNSEIESRIIAVDESGIASIEFDLTGHIINANNNFLQLFDYTLDEIKGKHHKIFITAKKANSNEYISFWDDLRVGKNKAGEYKRLTKYGAVIYIQGSYSILKDSHGAPKSILKLATDITEFKITNQKLSQQTHDLKAQEEELRQNMEELSSTQEEIERRNSEIESRILAVDQSGIASIEFDLHGHIITANNNFLNLMKYSLDQIIGKHHAIFVTDEYRESSEYLKFWDDLANGVSKYGEYKRNRSDNQLVFIQGSYSILKDRLGNPKSILKLAVDVTQYKQSRIQ